MNGPRDADRAVTGISVADVYALDVDAAQRIYVETFGFDTVADLPGSRPAEGWLTVGHPANPSLQLRLTRPGGRLSPVLRTGLEHALSIAKHASLGLVTTDMDRSHRALTEAGVRFLQEPVRRAPDVSRDFRRQLGEVEALITDGCGNLHILIEPGTLSDDREKWPAIPAAGAHPAALGGVFMLDLFVADVDEAVMFYRDVLGFEVGADEVSANGENRWVTIHHPAHPEVQACLLVPNAWFDDLHAVGLRAALGRHEMPGWGLTTDDCRRAYEELSAAGVEFVAPPATTVVPMQAGLRPPLGAWEAAFRDGVGNVHYLVEPFAAPAR
ncbi:VOC family protein [Microbacterium sp. X-17]|uniref:VOC family protein n=1 Tax=Microbacterium sp. X-17 TaxID=3144404 RepID=UPI0031F511E1